MVPDDDDARADVARAAGEEDEGSRRWSARPLTLCPCCEVPASAGEAPPLRCSRHVSGQVHDLVYHRAGKASVSQSVSHVTSARLHRNLMSNVQSTWNVISGRS